jgi:4-azaleucine resistance transporter AzlC
MTNRLSSIFRPQSLTQTELTDSFGAGLHAGVPFSLGGFLLSFSFGVAARTQIGGLAAVVMSVSSFAGASQFAALAVLSAGGDATTAIVAGLLVNLRFVPMGIAVAPSLRQGFLGRVARAQAIIDTSWAMSRNGARGYAIEFMLGASAVQYMTWVMGTIAGVLLGTLLRDPQSWGLDAIFPAFMLALLARQLPRTIDKMAAALAVAIALVLIPLTPAGIPIVAGAAAAVLMGVWR